MSTRKGSKFRYEDCPTAWFVVLERARIDGDTRREEMAQRELRRLGVRVEFDAGRREVPA